MMLKAKQNSFLKWFIGIVLLVVSVCSFMATAFAASDGSFTCSICGKEFDYGRSQDVTSKSYETAYSVPSLEGLASISTFYWKTNSNGDHVNVALYNNKEICLSCLETKIAEYKASTLNATVPASLPIHVGEDGKVTTASNASIKNNGSKPIVISSINIAASSGWTVQSKVDATNAKAGSKVIAIGFNNSWATPNSGNTSGSVNTSDFGKISASGTLNLAYDAVIPVAAAGGSADETAATATIVVAFPEAPTLAAGLGWYKSSVNQDTITKITLMDSYTPTTTANETWAADVNRTGDITCYRTGTEIIMAGNGAGKILANPDSNSMFADSRYSSGFKKLTAIENLRLLDTSKVTDMNGMFENCSGLTSLDLSNFDTSNVTGMSSMFSGCSGLTSLDASGFDTSNVRYMSDMFRGCSGLTSLDVSGFNTSNVTYMYFMFYNCSGLTSLDLSNFNTSKVTYMRSMFENCSGLTTIYAGDNWNTDNVTYSEHMFYNCTKLKGDIQFDSSYEDKTYAKTKDGYLTYKGAQTLTAGSGWYKSSEKKNTITEISFVDSYTPTTKPDETWNADVGDTGKIKVYRTGTTIVVAGNGSGTILANPSCEQMFAGFSALTNLAFSNFNTSNVTNMNAMFGGCRNLTSLDLSNFNTSKVTNMSSMFSACLQLSSLDLSNFNTGSVIDMSSMFKNCYYLPSLNISNLNTTSVINMSYMFNNCNSLTSLDVSKFDTSKVTNMFSMFDGCENLTSLNVSNFHTGNVTNMSRMFSSCKGLSSLDISTFNTSNVTDMSNMFNNCSSLSSLDISTFNTSNVTDMSYMFSDCHDLTSLGLSNFNTSNVSSMDRMFSSCSSLTSLDVSSFNTGKVTDMSCMFSDCRGLTSLNISNFNTSSVTGMSSMFYECSSLTSLDLSNFNTSNVTTMKFMFHNCSSLTSLNISNFDTSKVSNMGYMFQLSSSLTSLDLSNFNTSNVTNMSSMFNGCSNLSTIYAGDNWNTSTVTSSAGMFNRCLKLVGAIAYDSSKTDVAYANWTTGYLTHKAASRSIKLDVSSDGSVNGYTENAA